MCSKDVKNCNFGSKNERNILRLGVFITKKTFIFVVRKRTNEVPKQP